MLQRETFVYTLPVSFVRMRDSYIVASILAWTTVRRVASSSTNADGSTRGTTVIAFSFYRSAPIKHTPATGHQAGKETEGKLSGERRLTAREVVDGLEWDHTLRLETGVAFKELLGAPHVFFEILHP